MGIVTPWATSYPTTIDERVTSLPTLADDVNDVIASHPNALADAVVLLEKENFGYRDNVTITAATNETEDQLDSPRVVGSILFNGAALHHLIPHFRIIGTYNLNGGLAQGNLNAYLYDLGFPGTPLLPPELRATLSIPNTEDGVVFKIEEALTVTASPGEDTLEIHNSLRLYEVRISLDGAPTGATAVVHWVGIALGNTQ